MTATGSVGLFFVLATLLTAEAAYPASYAHRQPAPTAYNVQANPNYGFGPRVRVHPNDVVSGTACLPQRVSRLTRFYDKKTPPPSPELDGGAKWRLARTLWTRRRNPTGASTGQGKW
jgi:hypothetical protein